jgi:enoyl-[acyl-carrier protein] reductase / trans-2-enoyl-CoA reductase (NAD+)
MSAQDLSLFVKAPLGGVDRRTLVPTLAAEGPIVARADVERARASIRPAGVDLGDGACVLMLGGSNGMLKAVALQLLFGERVPVFAVHYDSAKLQVGPHHAAAIHEAAATVGLEATFLNDDATKSDVVANVVQQLASKYRVVHLINGIAAGATKRYVQHGKITVKDLDVAFDPVRQTPDWSRWENVRRVGLVEVDVATEQDIERTNKLMGTSTLPWVEALAEAKLLVPGRSVVSFADYDFSSDDPVYGMGPLAGAKVLQREAMKQIHERFGVACVRLCYPPLNTTAIGAIPGGLLMFAGTAECLLRAGTYRSIPDLAADTMAMFGASARQDGVLWMDAHYKAVLPEFHRLSERLDNENVRTELAHVVGATL